MRQREVFAYLNNENISPTDFANMFNSNKNAVTLLKTDPRFVDNLPKRINFCVKQMNQDIICILEGTISGFSSNWICNPLGQLLQNSVGAVAPRLIDENNQVFSNGLVLLPNGSVKPISKGKPRSDNGYFGWSKIKRGYSALSAECLLFQKRHFSSVGGFSENLSSPLSSTIDFCLKLKDQNLKNIIIPSSELFIQKENYFNKVDWQLNQSKEISQILHNKWKYWFDDDPAFNPNLSIIDDGQVIVNTDKNISP